MKSTSQSKLVEYIDVRDTFYIVYRCENFIMSGILKIGKLKRDWKTVEMLYHYIIDDHYEMKDLTKTIYTRLTWL